MTAPSNEQSLDGLIERVKAATGPDRAIDAMLFAIGDPYAAKHPWPQWIDDQKAGRDDFAAIPRFTASIDAALALVERCLPGTFIEISGPRKYLNIPTPVPARWRTELTPGAMAGWADTAPLAILTALLSALKDASE